MSITEANSITISDPSRFKLLTIFDFNYENVETKIRYGLPVTRVVSNIKISTDYTEYMASGGADRFVGDMAKSLGVDEKHFDVISITEGSTVFDYALQVDASSEFTLDELAKK